MGEAITEHNTGFSSDMAVFEVLNNQHPDYTNDTNPATPDSILASLINFSGADLIPGHYPAAYHVDVPLADAEGVFLIDSTFLPSGNQLAFLDYHGGFTPTYSPACIARRERELDVPKRQRHVGGCDLDGELCFQGRS